ncbi:MAG: flagellar biosynthesis anti-sigma factor FlgM [Oscillospiraceae bacterium]
MKINNVKNALNIYSNNKTNDNKISNKTTNLQKNNTDKIEISLKYNFKANVDKMSNKMAKDVENFADGQKIQSLKESIQNNDYNVSSTEIANAIIERLR